MKSLFYFMALVNVAVLMWEYHKVTESASTSIVKSSYTGGQRIILRHERKQGREDNGGVVDRNIESGRDGMIPANPTSDRPF